MIQDKQDKQFYAKALRGLELRLDPTARAVDSFRVLTNLDKTTPGAIQLTPDAENIMVGPTTVGEPIVEMVSFKGMPSAPTVVIGIDRLGNLWDVEADGLLATLGIACPRPFSSVVQGRWLNTVTNEIEDVNYLVYNDNTGAMWKWTTPLSSPIPFGVTMPSPVNNQGLPYVNRIWGSADPNLGQQFIVGRKYRYTFYNKHTDLESSPSEDALSSDASGRFLTFMRAEDIPQGAPYVTEIRLTLEFGNIAAEVADIRNSGYKGIKLYATRDGSDDFYLMTSYVVYEAFTGVWRYPSAKGVIPLGSPMDVFYIFDGIHTPVATDPTALFTEWPPTTPLEPDNNTFPNTPDPPVTDPRLPNADQIMVELAPLPGDNDPPEIANWGAIYQARLFLVSQKESSKLIFSRPGEFFSFPPENYIYFTADNYAPITSLGGQYQQLVVGKLNSTHRLIGSDFSNFAVTPLDPQVGIMGRRALVKIEGTLFSLGQQGLMSLASDTQTFYGEQVKPLTDLIPQINHLENVLMAVDSVRGQGLMTLFDDDNIDTQVLLFDYSEESPFSLYQPQIGHIYGLNEVELSTGEQVVLASTELGVWKLFRGVDYTLPAVIETQLIPTDPSVKRNIFRKLYATGTNIGAFDYEISYDAGQTFTYRRTLRRNNMLGVACSNIVIRFLTKLTNIQFARLATLRIDYVEVGETYAND